MKTTTKDYLVGIAFALGSLVTNFAFCYLFSHLKLDAIAFFSIILCGIIFIPIYFICKQDRSWRYGIAVAITTIIAMIPLIALIYLLTLWGIGAVLVVFCLYSAAFLPPVIDFVIFSAKNFYRWLGEREIRR